VQLGPQVVSALPMVQMGLLPAQPDGCICWQLQGLAQIACVQPEVLLHW
jgi:hypothetical protein